MIPDLPKSKFGLRANFAFGCNLGELDRGAECSNSPSTKPVLTSSSEAGRNRNYELARYDHRTRV